ncbi:MAG: phycobiliprotein lyase [Cyanobacteria bacterium P01_A01_bin.135]
MDAMDFFRLSEGRWRSQRTTHHLPFRRSETGDSEIFVETYPADHAKVVEICKLHDIDPTLAVGGAYVSWQGSMAWDKEGENHQGTTVFALVPDADNPAKGRLLRERGYAEIVPVVGRYEVDDEENMILTTEYESMSSVERFRFMGPNMRFRTSTVTRFGGFSTASFCAESRLGEGEDGKVAPELSSQQQEAIAESRPFFSAMGW